MPQPPLPDQNQADHAHRECRQRRLADFLLFRLYQQMRLRVLSPRSNARLVERPQPPRYAIPGSV